MDRKRFICTWIDAFTGKEITCYFYAVNKSTLTIILRNIGCFVPDSLVVLECA